MLMRNGLFCFCWVTGKEMSKVYYMPGLLRHLGLVQSNLPVLIKHYHISIRIYQYKVRRAGGGFVGFGG